LTARGEPPQQAADAAETGRSIAPDGLSRHGVIYRPDTAANWLAKVSLLAWIPIAAVTSLARHVEVFTGVPELIGAASLHDVHERDRQLAISFLDVQLAEHESGHFVQSNPSLAVGEAAFAVIALMTRPFASSAVRAAAAIDRLAAVAGFLSGARRSLTKGTPDEWKKKCLRECRGVDALLDSGIDRWIAADTIDEVSGKRLRREDLSAGP